MNAPAQPVQNHGSSWASGQNLGFSRKKYRVLLGAAAVGYVTSFFLTAVWFNESGHFEATFRGYECALLTLGWPQNLWGLTALIDGCINPALLLTLIFAKFHKKTLSATLGWLTAAMVLCSWIFFLRPSYYPREGYFLWIFSICFMLFALWKTSFHARHLG